MIEFYVTIELLDESSDSSFKTELTRNNIIIKNIYEENGSIQHYTLQGDWNGYRHISSLIIPSKEEGSKYLIHSLEHFEE